MFVLPTLYSTISPILWVLCLFVLHKVFGMIHEKLDSVDSDQSNIINEILKTLTPKVWAMSPRPNVDPSEKETTFGSGLFICFQPFVIGWHHETIRQSHDGSRVDHEMTILYTRETRAFLLQNLSNNDFSSNANATEPKVKKQPKVKVAEVWGSHYQASIATTLYTPPQITYGFLNTMTTHIADSSVIGGTFLVYGPPGSGKSSLPLLVSAKIPNSIVVTEFDPSEPGRFLGWLLKKYKGSDKTVILVLDEFDVLVKKVLDGSVKLNKHNKVEVHDKRTLNSFLDRLAKLENFICIATTNEPLSWWNQAERDFVTRPGRFSKLFELPLMSTTDAIQAFASGCKAYNVDEQYSTPPTFTREMPISVMADAFKQALATQRSGKLIYETLNDSVYCK